MSISRLGYYNTFYSDSTAVKKNAGSIGDYLGKYEESMASGEGEQEKDGFGIGKEKPRTGQTEVIRGSRLRDHLAGEDAKAPYYHLSDNGVINYNGVMFVCDTEHNQLHLGDTSDKKNCLTISLSGGGSLVVNRDNIDQLAKAISMFSPEDINLIMRALNIDAKARQVLEEIEDEECAVGEEITDGGENTDSAETAEEGESVPVTESMRTGEWKSSVYQSVAYTYDEEK
ncbi:MAG: hypothetical protein K2K54_07515 [Lachnospiraceae bacterium]|nr:hypothetical protein [Lachnospiraceae bacterium]